MRERERGKERNSGIEEKRETVRDRGKERNSEIKEKRETVG